MITQTSTRDRNVKPHSTPMRGTKARIGMACSATA